MSKNEQFKVKEQQIQKCDIYSIKAGNLIWQNLK